MVTLHEAVSGRRDEVMERWRANVIGTIAPEAMPTVELMDHLPLFLDEIIYALRAPADDEENAELRQSALIHGEQRLRLGFSLDAVVREYGAMRDAVIATGRDAGVQITFREAQTVFDATISGIANAVSEYARQRDAELYRQHNEHVAFLAHELRNPLSSSQMAMRILDERGQLPADDRPTRSLKRSLDKIGELIDHALEIAKVASGIEVKRQSITIERLLGDVEVMANIDAESKGVSLRLEIDDHVEVVADVRLIHSALSNVVRNAIKFSHAGGSVAIRSRVQGDRVVVEVEDDCGGLPPGKVEQAFAPFVRLNTDQQGFGLGLAIAKQAVDAHGGSLRVQNLPGKGCIFVLELPLRDQLGS